MATPQNAKAIESASYSDLEILMVAYFQKHPPKITVEDKKTLLAYLKNSYLSDQEGFKKIASTLIEGEVIIKGTYSTFIKRTKPSSKPVAKFDTKTLQRLIGKLNPNSTDNNFLDVTHKKPVQKKGATTKGGIPMPDPKEGEVLMKSTGKRASHREFWTDPSKGWNDDANKKQAHYQSRISRDTELKINAFLKATGMKKVTLTDEALKSFIEGYQYSDEELKVLEQELKPN